MKRIASSTIKSIATTIAQETNIDVNSVLEKKTNIINYDCYQEAVDHLVEKCFNLNVNLNFKTCNISKIMFYLYS